MNLVETLDKENTLQLLYALETYGEVSRDINGAIDREQLSLIGETFDYLKWVLRQNFKAIFIGGLTNEDD